MWFRFYSEALNDPKVQRLDGESFKGWVNLLCLAKAHDGSLPDTPDIAFGLRKSQAEVEALLQALDDAGLIEQTTAGLSPHNWDSRQYVSDNSTERVKRFRERSTKRYSETDATVSETPPEQSQSQKQSQKQSQSQKGVRGKTACRIPDDWVPTEEDFKKGREKGFSDEEIGELADEFRDYWSGRSKDATRVNWSGVFRNRLRMVANDSARGHKSNVIEALYQAGIEAQG